MLYDNTRAAMNINDSLERIPNDENMYNGLVIATHRQIALDDNRLAFVENKLDSRVFSQINTDTTLANIRVGMQLNLTENRCDPNFQPLVLSMLIPSELSCLGSVLNSHYDTKKYFRIINTLLHSIGVDSCVGDSLGGSFIIITRLRFFHETLFVCKRLTALTHNPLLPCRDASEMSFGKVYYPKPPFTCLLL